MFSFFYYHLCTLIFSVNYLSTNEAISSLRIPQRTIPGHDRAPPPLSICLVQYGTCFHEFSCNLVLFWAEWQCQESNQTLPTWKLHDNADNVIRISTWQHPSTPSTMTIRISYWLQEQGFDPQSWFLYDNKAVFLTTIY